MVAASVSKEIDVSAIPLDKYVTVSPDGHLQCEGKRVRYWGFIGIGVKLRHSCQCFQLIDKD